MGAREAGIEMQRKQQAIVRANWEIYRRIEGIAGVLVLILDQFNMARRSFFMYLLFHAYGLAFGSLLFPPEETPA